MATEFLNLSVDTTLGGNNPSDTLVPSQKAIKVYVDNQGGSSVAIDNSTITKNTNNELQAEAIINQNSASGASNPLYQWTGTQAEYLAQNIEVLHPDWICVVTDDSATIAFGDITGQPSDNANLATALSGKYDASNPSGYTSNAGTVTSVNNTSPDGNGNVTLSIPAAQVNSDWNAASGVAQILNKPTIPTVNNATLTITQGGTTKGTFTANASSDVTIDLDSGSSALLETLYPVGSTYITTNATCPLSTLMAGSNWSLISSGIVTAGDIPCKGNGTVLGLTDGSNYVGLRSFSYAQQGTVCTPDLYGDPVGTTGSNYINNNKGLGVTTDPTKSGIIADTSSLTLAVNIFKRTA